ncbi:aminotransferase class V-fold PLP-dependent enzyme [Williamsia soli]|uniref:aminotransferase class V-fold PLP-dependent enzyme n=1 Tax=Williamsia soli TaxID=364929 RepID=UPI001A9D4F96|nr:aminotransferase class V-fold PLP-dependent enzyme [Williamsia soli]
MVPAPDPKDVLAGFVRARVDDRVLFADDVDEAIALVADHVSGDVVLLDVRADLEISTASPGYRVVAAQVDLAHTLAAVEAEFIAREAELLIVPGVVDATGEVLPLSRLAAIAHRHGARVLVDAGQLATRRVINLTSHGIDYVVLSGAIIAGFGPAAVIGRGDRLPPADPAHVTAPVAHGFAQAVLAIADLGFDWIGLHEESLSAVVDEAVRALPGARRLTLWPDARDRVGLAEIAVAGRFETVPIRWGIGTGHAELSRQLNTLANVVFEQEAS